MKKLVLIGFGIGILNFGQANTITLIDNLTGDNPLLKASQINGNNAYLFLINLKLAPGQTISSAEVDFNNITLISSDAKDTVSAYLVNPTSLLPTHTYTDNDNSGNYFTVKPFLPSSIIGNEKKFTAPKWSKGQWVYDTETWSDVFNSTQLTTASANGGAFDIGIDPDCIYNIGSIKFTYTVRTVSVPDTATTAGLLGMSLLGLLAFRRKLALN